MMSSQASRTKERAYSAFRSCCNPLRSKLIETRRMMISPAEGDAGGKRHFALPNTAPHHPAGHAASVRAGRDWAVAKPGCNVRAARETTTQVAAWPTPNGESDAMRPDPLHDAVRLLTWPAGFNEAFRGVVIDPSGRWPGAARRRAAAPMHGPGAVPRRQRGVGEQNHRPPDDRATVPAALCAPGIFPPRGDAGVRRYDGPRGDVRHHAGTGAVLAPSVQASRWPPVQRRVRSHSQPLPAQASHQQRNRGHCHNARLAAKSSFAGFTRIYAAIDTRPVGKWSIDIPSWSRKPACA